MSKKPPWFLAALGSGVPESTPPARRNIREVARIKQNGLRSRGKTSEPRSKSVQLLACRTPAAGTSIDTAKRTARLFSPRPEGAAGRLFSRAVASLCCPCRRRLPYTVKQSAAGPPVHHHHAALA